MIFVDTSVWIAADRNPIGSEAEALRSLLAADRVEVALPVRLELLAGIPSQRRQAFQRAFSALPVAYPTDDTWVLIDEWVPKAADEGRRFTVSDLLIAALAHQRGALVWSLDRDFGEMETVGFVRLYG